MALLLEAPGFEAGSGAAMWVGGMYCKFGSGVTGNRGVVSAAFRSCFCSGGVGSALLADGKGEAGCVWSGWDTSFVA